MLRRSASLDRLPGSSPDRAVVAGNGSTPCDHAPAGSLGTSDGGVAACDDVAGGSTAECRLARATIAPSLVQLASADADALRMAAIAPSLVQLASADADAVLRTRAAAGPAPAHAGQAPAQARYEGGDDDDNDATAEDAALRFVKALDATLFMAAAAPPLPSARVPPLPVGTDYVPRTARGSPRAEWSPRAAAAAEASGAHVLWEAAEAEQGPAAMEPTAGAEDDPTPSDGDDEEETPRSDEGEGDEGEAMMADAHVAHRRRLSHKPAGDRPTGGAPSASSRDASSEDSAGPSPRHLLHPADAVHPPEGACTRAAPSTHRARPQRRRHSPSSTRGRAPEAAVGSTSSAAAAAHMTDGRAAVDDGSAGAARQKKATTPRGKAGRNARLVARGRASAPTAAPADAPPPSSALPPSDGEGGCACFMASAEGAGGRGQQGCGASPSRPAFVPELPLARLGASSTVLPLRQPPREATRRAVGEVPGEEEETASSARSMTSYGSNVSARGARLVTPRLQL